MHQHMPVLPLVPHSNAVPQRAQARRRRGSPCAVGVVIVSLLGIIVCEINHPLVTALRQMQSGRLIHALPSLAPAWPQPRSMLMISTVFLLNRKEHVDDRPALLDHAERS
jgi:hypothetical protein